MQPHRSVQALGSLADLGCFAFSHQLERNIKLTKAVKLLHLPSGKDPVRPGQKCSVAGWGRVTPEEGTLSDKLQEVELTVQKDQECENYLQNYYNPAIQLCVGNRTEQKASFKVRLSLASSLALGRVVFGERQGPGDPSSGELFHPPAWDLSPRGATRAGEK